MVKDSPPHLSVVAVSRNDNHGGDMLGRMQLFVDGFFAQCKRHQLRAELILVEWNPPQDRPPLSQALSWPSDPGPATARVVTVPADLHRTLPYSEALPLFQMLGKNVGIRRARGEFVLATNVDVLLDDRLVLYLRDSLSPRTSVRVDRFDVPADVARNTDFAVTLADCRARFFQSQSRDGVFDVETKTFVHRKTLRPRWKAITYALRLVKSGAYRAHRATPFTGSRVAKTKPSMPLARRIAIATRRVARYWRKWGLFWRSMRRVLRMPLPAVARVAAVGRFADLILSAPNLKRSRAWIPELSGSRFRWGVGSVYYGRRPPARPHTMASGDFTLLSRDDWFRLRGYPDWPMYSWHLDSVLLYAARADGIREIALDPKYRLYHIDHSAGSGWSPEAANQLFDRLRGGGIPFLTDTELETHWRRFMRRPETCIVNGEDWGFSDRSLVETVVAGGRSIGAIANCDR